MRVNFLTEGVQRNC